MTIVHTLGLAVHTLEVEVPAGWKILIGREPDGRWWATASEPWNDVTRSYRIVSTTERGRPPVATAALAVNALVAMLRNLDA